MNRSFHILSACLALAALIGGCDEGGVDQPASLETPRTMTVARGEVCLSSVEPSPGAVRPRIQKCGPDQRGAIGLIANQTGDSVAVVDMSRGGDNQPRLVDLDRSIPGVTHIPVGRSPVDVAAGTDSVAYALNQADRSISVINLWVLKALPEKIVFDEAPKRVAISRPPADEQGPGQLLVALSNPGRLWVHDSVSCAFPGAEGEAVDRATTPADAECGAVPGEADGQVVDLPATVADLAVAPSGDRAFVVYSDANFASAIALRQSALDEMGGSCLDGASVPCEAARVGLTIDCHNGVDDDGDGVADRLDPQCFGPRGSEIPDGIGRNPLGACSNAMDDDGDGFIDREDPECLTSGGDSEEQPLVDDAPLACSDTLDNDGDGAVDFPADAACYGDVGRTEREFPALGFASVDVGPFGLFLYAVDRARDQLVIADATRLELVDAFNPGGRDRTPFASEIGVPIPPAPTAVAGHIQRRVVWTDPRPDVCVEPEGDDDPGYCKHAIVRYDHQAFVASDNSRTYVVNTMSTFCEVFETGEADIVSNADFFFGSQALAASAERNCLTVPDFPVSYDVAACEELEACSACRLAGDSGCEEVCADLEQTRQDCFGERLQDVGNVRVSFNPNFELEDSNTRSSRVLGLGTCQTPERLVDALQASVPAGSVDLSCSSPLRPQPVRPGTSEEAVAEADFERAALLEDSILALVPGEALADEDLAREGRNVEPFQVVPRNELSIDDQSIVEEAWTVTYEGVLPTTRRDDGVIVEDEPGHLDVAGLDLCAAGVQVGDRLTLRSEPSTTDEDLPEDCQVFVTEEENLDFLTWEIAKVQPRQLVLSVIEEEGEANEFVDELPTRGCFAEGVSYQIRANGEWIVVGDRTGYLSDRMSVLGACVPKYKADNPRFDARVDTGELFEGPYLSFFMRPGEVEPVRGPDEELTYRFAIDRAFRADRFTTTPVLPSKVLVEGQLPLGRLLLIPDPSQNLIYVKRLDIADRDRGEFLIQ